MLTLAWDTCLDACSVAIWRPGEGVLAAHAEPMRQGHAERLMPMIAAVLAEAGAAPAQISDVAVTVGPGTFTGIRIGIAAARGLSLATGARVRAATSLALLAATARARLPAETRSRPLAVCLDARKGEVLLEIVPERAAGGLDGVRLLDPVAAATAVREAAPDALLIGSGAALVAAAAGDRLEAVLVDLLPEARHLGAVPLTPVARPTPLYARPPDARPPSDAAVARAP